MSERRRRLIEVAFPLEEVSAHSRREKNIHSGHISTLHIWWARRPLAACRAYVYASLIDDPDWDQERDELLREVADLASWDAVRRPEEIVRPRSQGGSGLTGARLLERARQRILASNGGNAPRLLDPFAGGGAIPLEALRLGCEVQASDLNPVAVLILKGTVEYPQKFGRPDGRPVPSYIRDAAEGRDEAQRSFVGPDAADGYHRNPLATDVRYWGHWMLDRARAELTNCYPRDSDGSVPTAYLWSRTVDCPNCGAEMPLLRQYWIVRKAKRSVALKAQLDRTTNRVSFAITEGGAVEGDPSTATTSGGDTLCLLCRQVVTAEYVRNAGREGKIGSVLTCVVLDGVRGKGKRYRAALPSDRASFEAATQRLLALRGQAGGELSLIPDEPINPDTLGLRIDRMGFTNWGQLFNDRQVLVLATFAKLVRAAHDEMLAAGLEPDYAVAVTTYLAITVDRLAVRGSNQCIYHPGRETIENEISRGVLPPVWDYAEAVSVGRSSGSWLTCLDGVCAVITDASITASTAFVEQRDATVTRPDESEMVVITDPPYYAAVDYAGLSDFFYVWLKRSIGFLYPDLLNLPLTPKKQQAIMASESKNEASRQRYIDLMQAAFSSLQRCVGAGHVFGVVFASIDASAWATLIESLLVAGLVPESSWPIDTEMESGMAKIGQARLKTSVWMACRPRNVDAAEAFISDVIEEMRASIRDRLLTFWRDGIRGADFFISAIGPALSVYGRHSRVLRPDGTEVTVRDFLDLVRREATQVALEQVLHGADLGIIDPVTRQYVTWVWGYSRAPLDAGEAIALCLATGADYDQVVRPASIALEARERSKKVVRLRTVRERGRDDDNLGLDSPARPAPLIDQLQRAANLWSANRMEELGTYRAEVGETRWAALRTLGQAVAECLPDGDEDRRLIFGLLGSNVRVNGSRVDANRGADSPKARLPGFE